MEAIAALSFACNVINLVEFGCEAASLATQIYEDGSSRDHKALDESCTRLKQVLVPVQNHMATAPKPIDQTLADLDAAAGKAAEAATDLQARLDKLKGACCLPKKSETI